MNWARIDRDIACGIAPTVQPFAGRYNTGSAPFPAGQSTPGLHLAELLDILRRRRKLILTIALCGTLLAAALALLIAPKYTAAAQLIVEPAPGVNGQSGSPTSDESLVDTQVKMMTSYDHLQRVVESLLADPKFTSRTNRSGKATHAANENTSPEPALADTERSWISEINHRLHIWTGTLFRNRNGAPLDIEDLQRRLNVTQEDRSRIITVRYTSRSPQEAAFVANRAVQLYVDGQEAQRSGYESRDLAQLRGQLSEARDNVARSAAAVQKAIREQAETPSGQAGEEARNADARLRMLERDAAASALNYARLQRRENEILNQRGATGPSLRIVSLAKPPTRPSSHNPLLFILPILIILLIGGSFVAVIMEQSDTGLRSERDIRDTLGIACAGLIPRLPDKENMKPHQHMLTEPFSAYTESIRSVVGQLWLTTPQRAPRAVLISSSVPGEGKTTAAVSIAVCAASLGRRVLLIDLDFKRPSVARELGSDTDKEIFDILLRNRPAAEVVTHIPDLGIDYLAMSISPLDALPSFVNQRLPLLLRQLSESYDSVVIDGPPLLGFVEARLLALLADKVVFVVKWGSTRREVAQNAINLLRKPDRLADDVDIPIAVLTQADLKVHASYRYGDAGEALATYENYYSRPNRF
jgi:uncharacterized protein involved in exopolysaccharide biosynthesis/Mrp family chromosome partitioning ATPase